MASLYASGGTATWTTGADPAVAFKVSYLLDNYAVSANPVVKIKFKAPVGMASVASPNPVESFKIKFLSGGFANTVEALTSKCKLSIAGAA